MRAVLWESGAVDDLLSLATRDRSQARRIFLAVRTFASEARGDVRKLEGRAGEWRLRVGDWRVIFAADPATNAVHVLAVRQRRDAYD